MGDLSLRITEIFYSLQGEAQTQGLPTVFIRLTGCPLRCTYCDTAYAFHGGSQSRLDEILARVAQYGARYVTVTGGEPLAQPNCLPLLNLLCDQAYSVSLETSGALAVDDVDPRVSVVLDLKTPDSGELHRNRYENLTLLKATDQVKFVICSRGDYEWARAQIDLNHLQDQAGEILFSPCHDRLPVRQLADWILEDRLMVRLQMQLHKLLWQDQPGH